MKKGFLVEMADKDYYSLRNLLNLKPSSSHFTSNKFLSYIEQCAPKHICEKPVSPRHLVPFRKHLIKEDAHKTKFLRWCPHSTDGRTVSEDNLAKTGFLIGKKCEQYCRTHNISSCWTADDGEYDENIVYPWKINDTGK